MGIYLNGSNPRYPSLLDVVRGAGLEAVPNSGWEWRARSSGGFPDSTGPMGVVIHHTASPANSTPGKQFSNDLAYCSTGHEDAPVGNLVLGPEGQVGIVAGGAANTQGKGGPWTTSRGAVPLDSGNSRLIAIEASNDGMGQPWSKAQCDSYVALCDALAKAYGFRRDRWGTYSSDFMSHEEWTKPSCPGRKCDPAGPAVGRTWAPQGSGGCNTGNIWVVDRFRSDLQQFSPTNPEPPPEEEDYTMLYYIVPKLVDGPPGYDPAHMIRFASGRLIHAGQADAAFANDPANGVPTITSQMSSGEYNRLLAETGSTYPPAA